MPLKRKTLQHQRKSWMVKYVKRYANSAAHILVRKAFSCVIDRVLVEKKFKTVFMIL
jgi:hypothetical protein